MVLVESSSFCFILGFLLILTEDNAVFIQNQYAAGLLFLPNNSRDILPNTCPCGNKSSPFSTKAPLTVLKPSLSIPGLLFLFYSSN
uniref:Uncharacterized protein n=1 Tax=Utricularia reniformis TaxID=192314 RepID=A0A1Y0B0T2_9LAMI|nr:hypothetical protein AEK19_MT0829 [Utricularia reniformis]YP_009382309.1 hypothetical protein AEK19_MT1881 [Utricularia reniformis]ART31062.1 hypothetical protein AEK19_MT0829 [Utricularia reniformis]ART32050.1 hypothetical protein AEK19_MT1881 [Utricularia reniformis]